MAQKFGLIGSNISHSKSPLLFNAAYPGSGMSYILIDEPNFSKALSLALKLGLKGVNVTTPFKDEAFMCAQKTDEITATISASNLLLFDKGKISAMNTDYYGVLDTLRTFAGDKKRVIVIGCGGAGRAAALASRDFGADVVIANRTLSKASDFAAKIGASAVELSETNIRYSDFDIIINTLPSSATMLNISEVKDKIIFEANYSQNRLNTVLLNGNTYISGEYWLINQAIPAFRVFTGKDPDIKAMRLSINI